MAFEVKPAKSIPNLARVAVTLCASILLICVTQETVQAQRNGLNQQRDGHPGGSYYNSIGLFNQGDLNDAARQLRNSSTEAYRGVNGRFVDSICYHTMLGECLYQLGDLDGALEQYNAALAMYVLNPRWCARVEMPASVQEATSAVKIARISWGKSERKFKVAAFPDAVALQIGSDAENFNALQRGGAITSVELRRFNMHEIMRCTALSMSRRAEILGPLARYDAFSRQIADVAAGGFGNANNYTVVWGRVMEGISLSMMGEKDNAVKLLKSAIQAPGNYDHPLTPLVLLELAKISFESAKYKEAGTYSLEAGYAAAIFRNHTVLVESFQIGTAAHLITGGKGLYPPLKPASQWARTNGSKQLEAALPILAAQCMAESGQPSEAEKALGLAIRPLKKRDLKRSILHTDFSYRSAQAGFQKGNFPGGLKDLGVALKSQTISSKRLYQIRLADQMYLAGKITPHTTSELFKILLREPTEQDWLADPLDTLAYISQTQLKERTHWFEIAISRKEHEKALEISDDIRRHRFFSTLPAGGRMLALQWMLESPEDSLTAEALALRQAFQLKHPLYETLSSEADALRKQLQAIPLAPEEKSPEKLQQKELLKQLEELTTAQERVLADISLRREPSIFGFPPQLSFNVAQQELAEGQALLSFLSTDRGVYSFIMTRSNYAYQQVTEPKKIKSELTNLLRKIGNIDPNIQLKPESFADESWRQPAAELMKLLLPKATADFWRAHDELIIVPDGPLWYLPFEILQVVEGDEQVNLFEKVKIRYAPTVATALGDKRPIRVNGQTGFVTGKLFLRDELAVSVSHFEEIKPKVANAVKVPFKLPGTSKVYASFYDSLVIWDDVDNSARTGGYDWSPLQIDRGKPGSTLDAWMSLPNESPDQIYLPGYTTNAASGMKNRQNGDEVFLSVCGLMASGTRTILLSRWRTAGESAYKLTGRMVRNVPKLGPVDAWRDSVEEFLLDEELDIALEPRIKKSTAITKIKNDHPFFWSGYMLIDTGSKPNKE